MLPRPTIEVFDAWLAARSLCLDAIVVGPSQRRQTETLLLVVAAARRSRLSGPLSLAIPRRGRLSSRR